jgi:hypothetical protein
MNNEYYEKDPFVCPCGNDIGFRGLRQERQEEK